MDDQESLKLQLAQIKMLSELEPENEEYQQLQKDLEELIELSNSGVTQEMVDHIEESENDEHLDSGLYWADKNSIQR